MKKLFISVGLIILYASMAMALKPNKITYMNDRYDKNGKQTSSGGLIATAGLGCFDEESCAFTAKAVEDNPKLKPYTDYIGKPAEILVGKGANPDNFREADDKGWPAGTVMVYGGYGTVRKDCLTNFNADKDLKTIIGFELMNTGGTSNACEL